MKSIKLFYSNCNQNWGDQYSPAICQLLSGCPIVYVRPGKCDMMAVGSILTKLKKGFFSRRVHVWGSGFIEHVAPYKTRHIIHAVRGKKTSEIFTNVKVSAFGDPGLLCDMLLPDHTAIKKKYDIGIVSHHLDRNNPKLLDFIQGRSEITTIDVFMPTVAFLEKMASCRLILSSSLHGLVAADAMGIANTWLKLSDKVRGNDFKFQDYYSIFDIEMPEPLTISDLSRRKFIEISESYSRPEIDSIKRKLIDAFPFKKQSTNVAGE